MKAKFISFFLKILHCRAYRVILWRTISNSEELKIFS